MKEPYMEGLANHHGLESCVGRPQGRRRSVDRGCAGCEIELRNNPSRLSTSLYEREDNMRRCVTASADLKPAESEDRSMYTHSLHGTREILEATTSTSRKWSGWERSMTARPACTQPGSRTEA